LVLGYRYRLVASRGKISGGDLYEGVDDIFAGPVAVLFAPDPNDRRAVGKFVEGYRMFGELGGGRGLIKLRDLGAASDRRPHAVFDWIAHGTLDRIVQQRGPIDQAMLHELVSDLLVGLGKAHRAMPSLVHGHIHPGKIGFVSPDQAVLFGFEYARQVFEQDSHLADAFVTSDEDTGPTRASDLQQLGVSLFYAATGEWPNKSSISEQVARVQQRLSGPLATVLARMIAAGTAQGYSSAIDALIDFDDLNDGSSKWQARTRMTSTARQAELDAAAWTPSRSLAQHDEVAAPQQRHAPPEVEPDEVEPDELEPDEDDEPDEDFEDRLEDILQSESPSRPPPVPHYSIAPPPEPPRWQPPAPAPAKSVSFGRVLIVIMGSLFAFFMCVGAIVSEDDTPPPPPPVHFQQRIEPIPPPLIAEPIPTPEIIEPPPQPTLSGIHHYRGKVTGPDDRVGISSGTSCDVWIEPNDSPGLNCRFHIDCGKKRIYGGGEVGFSNCTIEEGHPTLAADEDMDAPDGAFMAALAGPDPMVLVQDVWQQPPVRVLISISDGGLVDGPIPDVKLAKRMSREEIEAAILRDGVPER
jgi:hypothetical protein